MNVVIIGSKQYDTLEYHIAYTFRMLGHNVIIKDLDDVIPIKYIFNYHAIKYIRRYDVYMFKEIARQVVEIKPDLVIGTYRFIHPECIKIIKKKLRNTRVIHVNPDALTTFEYQQIFASNYDYYFSKDKYVVSFMSRNMKLNAFYLPEAFNPVIHKRKEVNRLEYEILINIDILAFGNLYPYRVKMIKELIASGLNVTLYGKIDKRYIDDDIGKRFHNEWITGERKADVLLGSKIVFNNFHYAEIESVNCKFFEIFGVGAFQICDYRSGLIEYSKIDPREYTFTSINHAVELINYYIDKPSIRYEIADIQYKHFLKNHTYEHRVNMMLEIIYGTKKI